MCLDELEWKPAGTSGFWEVARVYPIAVYRATDALPTVSTRGTFTIYEHERDWINSTPGSRVWRDLDQLTAQAIFFHLTQKGNP